DLHPAHVEHQRGARADLVSAARATQLGQELETQIARWVEVEGDVAATSRAIEEIAGAVETRWLVALIERAIAFLGVEVEAHAQVVDLECFESTDCDVPLVP